MQNEIIKKEESEFDGHWYQLLGWDILASIITICTLGICFPWAMCLICDWECKHTIVDGKRLAFDGKGHQLFGKYICWILLSIITIGIYWIVCGQIAMKKWETKHTHFAE